MEIRPIPLTVGTRIKRSSRGKSDRLLTFQTKTKGEMTSTTDFAFVVEMTASAIEDGRVEELRLKIHEASRVTQEKVLTPAAWIPPGRPFQERPLQLDGLFVTVRKRGAGVDFSPAEAVGADDRLAVEQMTSSLLDHATSEMDVPEMDLEVGREAPLLAAPIRKLLATELGWGRVTVDSLRRETDPASVVVESMAAGEGGSVATLRFRFGADLEEGVLGSALRLAGTLRILANGRPVELTAEGATEQRFRTMAGVEGAKGTVSLQVTWE